MVLERGPSLYYLTGNKCKSAMWLCKCDCGNVINVKAYCLKSGHTKSCGCYHRDLALLGIKNKKPPGISGFNTLLYRYKRNAKIKGISFNISKKKFREITSKKCYYCGSLPVQESTGNYSKIQKQRAYEHSKYLHNGIDRLNPSKGYLLSNVVSCCSKCNYMKHILTKEEFFNQVKKIYECQLLD